MRPDRFAQRIRHFVAAAAALINLFNRLAPPLQANSAEHGLAHQLAHAGDLGIEQNKREQRRALARRHKERAHIAVGVGGAGGGGEAERKFDMLHVM